MLLNIYFSNKYCSFEILFKESWKMHHGFPKDIEQCNFINIDNKCFSWAANQYIIMISEDHVITEDWIDDAENSALHHTNKLHCLYLLQLKTVIYIFTIYYYF